MSTRTSRTTLEALVTLLSTATGEELLIDHNPTYGGAVLETKLEGGGVTHPFGPARRSITNLADAIRLALTACEYARRNNLRND